MKRTILATVAVVLFCLVHIETTSAQSTNASVGGFVQDPSQAFIPGATVTATNTQTGVVTKAVTNESGTYNIIALLPGTYRLTAELPGFKTQVINDVQLGQSATARYNFTLQVGAASTTIEVTAEATALIAESSATIGNILSEKQVRDLPLVSNNVLDLMQTMAGVRGTDLTENTTFAGVSTSMVNTVRDGLSVQNGRYANGVGSVTMLHPDMVEEFRVILSRLTRNWAAVMARCRSLPNPAPTRFTAALFGQFETLSWTRIPGPTTKRSSMECGRPQPRPGSIATI